MPFISPAEKIWLENGIRKGRNENAYENIESILDVKFGQAGVALMPRVLLIQDSVALKSLHIFLVMAPDLDAVRERLPATE